MVDLVLGLLERGDVTADKSAAILQRLLPPAELGELQVCRRRRHTRGEGVTARRRGLQCCSAACRGRRMICAAPLGAFLSLHGPTRAA